MSPNCTNPNCRSDHGASTALGRRQMLRLAFGCGAAITIGSRAQAAPRQDADLFDPPALFDWGNPGRLSARAIALVETTNTIDMLCQMRNSLVVRGEPNNMEMVTRRFRQWFDDPSSIRHNDLRRYFLSGIDVIHYGTDMSSILNIPEAFDRAEWFYRGFHRIVETHPDWFSLVLNPSDLAANRHLGKIKIILGMQNGDHFRTPADVAHFHGLGQRVSQLTYNRENALGGGAFSQVGLKPYGRDVIRAMNAAGMVLDLAHSNAQTALEACAETEVTPIISHTNCRALNAGFDRAMPDEVIRAFAAKGGVIGVTVVRQFVSPNEPTTIEDFLNHIDHIVNLVGVEHVGIGNDNDLSALDGVDPEAQRAAFAAPGQAQYRWRERTEIDGLDHPRRFYDICEGLVRRGYSDEHIRLVLGGNWERVLTHIWTTRA
jgi:membrane dipeptidase